MKVVCDGVSTFGEYASCFLELGIIDSQGKLVQPLAHTIVTGWTT